MYRVVTHTIKEEHFEHPYLAEQGMAVHTANVSPVVGKPKPMQRNPQGHGSVITQPPTDGNIRIKMPLNEEWGDYEWYGEYHAWGDLTVHGKMHIKEDLIVEGTIAGRGSVSTVRILDTEPTGNTWTGNVGELAKTSSHMYLCVEPDQWIRWSTQSSW